MKSSGVSNRPLGQRPSSDDFLAPIRSEVVRYFALLAGAAVLVLGLTGPLRGEPPVIMASYGILLALFAVVLRARRTHPLLAGALCALGPLVLVTIMVDERGGMANPAAIAAYVTLVLVTGFVWNAVGTGVVALLSSATLAWFVSQAPDGAFQRVQQWGELTLQLLIVWGIVRLSLAALARSQFEASQSDARFHLVVDSAPEAIVGLDEMGLVRLFNRTAVSMSGLTSEQVLGQKLADLAWFDAEQLASLTVQLDGGAALLVPLELTDTRGHLFDVDFARLMEKSGPLHLLSFRDVTERRRATEAREALEARLTHSRSIDALGRLAGGVAHDFNNLLTVITSSAEILRSRASLSVEAVEDVARIEDAAQRAAGLTGQLLAFGRKQVLEPRVIRLEQTFEGLRPLLGRLIPENIRLDVAIAADLGAVKVDEVRLEQVLLNLISNACDAMHEGGQLSVRARNVEQVDVLASDSLAAALGPCIELLVEDTGRGMDAEVRERLFEPFFTTKAWGQGTGLGLATVHGIVAQSGGHIAVESQLGSGSRFFVYLPRTNERVAVPPVVESAPARASRAYRILLVEDQPDVRAAMKRMLECLGHHVETAADGQQALQIWAERGPQFDLLISDVVMPGMDGPSLARRLREGGAGLKVLFVSGYPEDSLSLRGALSEQAAYLPKPFTLRSLSDKLAEALASA